MGNELSQPSKEKKDPSFNTKANQSLNKEVKENKPTNYAQESHGKKVKTAKIQPQVVQEEKKDYPIEQETRKHGALEEPSSHIPTLKSILQELYRKQDVIPKLIDDDKIPEQHLKDYYIKLQIILKQQQESSISASGYDQVKGEKANIEIEKIFESLKPVATVKGNKKTVDEKKDDGNKAPAGDIPQERQTASKILLVGGAGVGKTTLLQYMAYRWSENKLWNNKFDYVFRVKLKKLITSWDKEWKYSDDDYNMCPLICFIHVCLEDRAVMSKIKTSDILQIVNNGKALLLLDGYDEVAHLGGIEKVIINTALVSPNIIMTSRPNALTGDIASKFERQVENIGLDDEGIKQYLDKAFKTAKKEEEKESEDIVGNSKLKDSLWSFLQVNPSVKHICTVPINTAMLSLIWHDPVVRTKFSGQELLAGSLYEEMIVWLGKRYVEKTENKKTDNIAKEQVFQLKEVQFLENVAQQEFTDKEGKLIIAPEVIKTWLARFENLELEQIHKFGLLKPEGEQGKGAIEKPHYFVHLTFQEYFTAYKLYEELKKDGAEANKAAELIAVHRNEPRYLMTLKFLAGIVSSDTSPKGSLARQRYIEAVTCNVDGVLELGLEKKVTLLMNLLAQTRNSDNFNEETKNLIGKAQELIEIVVLEDIGNWTETIKLSGYLSDNIKECLQQILAGDFTWGERKSAEIQKAPGIICSVTTAEEQKDEENKEVKKESQLEQKEDELTENSKLTEADNVIISVLELVGEIWHKLDIRGNKSKKELYENISNLARNAKWQVAKSGIKVFAQITSKELTQKNSEVISKEGFEELLRYLITTMKNNNLMAVSAKGIGEILTASNDSELITGTLKELMPSLKGKDYDERKAAAEVLGKIAKASGKKLADSVSEVIKELVLFLKNSYARKAVASALGKIAASGGEKVAASMTEVIKELVPLLKDEDSDARKAAVEALSKIAASGGEKVAASMNEVIKKLMPLLEDESKFVRQYAAAALGKIAAAGGEKVAAEVVAQLLPLLKDSAWQARDAAADALGNIAASGGEKVAASMSEVIKELMPLLKDKYADAREAAAEALGKIAAAGGEKVAAEVVDELAPLLKDSDARYAAADALGKIAAAGGEKVAAEVVDELAPLLKDSDARYAAADALGKIAAAGGEKVAASVSEVIKELVSFFLITIRPFKIQDAKIVANKIKGVEYVLGKIMAAGGEKLAASMSADIMSTVIRILVVSVKRQHYVSKTAAEALGKIAAAGGEKVENSIMSEVTKELLQLLKQYYMRFAVADIIVKIVAAGGEKLASEVIKELVLLLKDSFERYVAAYALGNIAEAGGEKVATSMSEFGVVKELVPLLKDKGARYAAAEALGKIAASGGEKLADSMSAAVGELVPLLKAKDSDARGAAAFALGKIAAAGGEKLASELIKELVPLLKDSDAREDAVSALGNIVAGGGEKLANSMTAVIGELVPFLKDEYARYAAASALGKIAAAIPFTEAAKFLQDNNPELRSIVTKALTEKLTKLNNVQNDTKLIKGMLAIIGQQKFDDSQKDEKDLQDAAKTALYKQFEFFDDEMMQYVNSNFEQLQELSIETKTFFKEILHKALADGSISQTDSEFIIKCIENNITVSVTKNSEIIFEGRTYKLSGSDNQQYIDAIARAALKQDNILAKQYRENEPLFDNQENGIRKAAADIKEVKSLVTAKVLDSNHWQVSLMQLSDHKKTLPLKEVFLLLEGRDAFGNTALYKILGSGKVQWYNVHPNDVVNYLQAIFGSMEYVSVKPRYYASSFEVDYQDVQKLMKYIKSYNTPSEEKSIEPLTGRELLIDFLSKILGTELINAIFQIKWEDYVKQATELKKTQLLQLSDEKIAEVKRQSLEIEHRDKFNNAISDVQENISLQGEVLGGVYVVVEQITSVIGQDGHINNDE